VRNKYTSKATDGLVCQRCKHSWDYRGKNPFFTLCPRCRTTVRTKKKNKLPMPVEVGRPVQASTVQITGDEELQP